MVSSDKKNTFDNLPQAVAELQDQIKELKTLMENHTTYGGFSPWMDVEELCEYLPGHPAKCTIYGWCAHDNIPHHMYGKTSASIDPKLTGG